MKRIGHKPCGFVLPLVAGLLLTACASPPTLYQWEGYQGHVYSYLRGDQDNSAPDKQIAAMEADLQKILAKGNTPPPGYHAHIGMLYASVGQTDMMVRNFQEEAQRFPESAPYLAYLQSKLKQ